MKRKEIFCIGFGILILIAIHHLSFYHNFIIAPLFIALCIAYFMKTRNFSDFVLYPLILLTTLCAVFSFTELYMYINYEPDPEATEYVDKETAGLGTYGSNWYSDPILGYGSKEQKSSLRSIKVLTAADDKVIYDVVYSTDAKGRRITIDNTPNAEYAVVLLGCSFTFGEGLNDKETFAWKLSEQLGEKYQVLNYGFHGYGSHQMLALLQSNRLDFLKNTYKKIYFYYLTFPGIELRSAGFSDWDRKGPKYLLNEENAAIRSGTFNDNSLWPHHIPNLKHLKKSLLLKRVYASLDQSYIIYEEKEKQIQLHASIIAASAEETKKKFDNSTFTTVIYKNFDELKTLLQAEHVRTLELNDSFLPQGPDSPVYAIPHDRHPTAAATTIVAEKYLQDILNSN